MKYLLLCNLILPNIILQLTFLQLITSGYKFTITYTANNYTFYYHQLTVTTFTRQFNKSIDQIHCTKIIKRKS